MSKLKFYLVHFFLIFFFNSNTVFSASFTFPSSLTTNTSDFVLLSETGTTPSVSGFSTDVLITIRATAGFVKITTVSGLEQINGYCGYTADSNSEPSNCADDNRSEIGFEGTQSEVNAALATLSFKGDGSTSSVSITASATPTGAAYNSENGHYYRAVSATDIRWDDARAAAKSEAQKFNGLTGYLVNITTAQENDFVANKVSVNAWTGGSDSGTERVWKWMDGPEAGQTYTCQTFGVGGTGAEGTIDGVVCTEQSYLNWDFGEPNQYNGTNEDYMHVYGTGAKKGSWNDYVINNSNVDAYIIEYGGMGGTATPYNYNENVSSTTSPNDGAPSSFGSHCSATGGKAGRSYYSNNTGTTGHAIPGVGSGGDINIRGGYGDLPTLNMSVPQGIPGGLGGVSFWGGPGRGAADDDFTGGNHDISGGASSGSSGGAFGAGGSAGSRNFTGGAGTNGVVVVENYA